MGLRSTTRMLGSWTVLAVEGELSANTAWQLHGRLREALELSPLVALDITDATVQDATPLAVLAGVLHRGPTRPGVVVAIVPDPAARHYLNHAEHARNRATSRLVVCPSREEFAIWLGEPRPARREVRPRPDLLAGAGGHRPPRGGR
ncbi:hypothetical protein [Spirillospora sp. CA-294931]|uniref:hypothetical protein n=1 Tax=Spirillospora sp. CA-294931 TaxID=3240042 RepID=UPI003D924209